MALPALKNTSVPNLQLARLANRADGAATWDATTVSKFKEGTVRTARFANALSHVLGIPQPFFTAATAGVAIEMALLARAADSMSAADNIDDESGSGVSIVDRASAIDAAANREFATTIVDSTTDEEVPLAVYGKAEPGERSVGRPRSRRTPAGQT